MNSKLNNEKKIIENVNINPKSVSNAIDFNRLNKPITDQV